METNDIDLLIARYLDGQASEQETRELLSLIETSEATRREFYGQMDLWNALHPAFSHDSIDDEGARRRVSARISSSARLWRYVGIAAAAAAFVMAVGSLIAFLNAPAVHEAVPMYTAATKFGYTMEAILPDSTHVWLNANSSLVYPARFDKEGERVVSLSGEAYFAVKADREHPFRVQAGDVSVTATGTQFNVNAYDNSPDVGVTLVEGAVAVGVGNSSYAMLPGQYMAVNRDGSRRSKKADIDKYCSWRDGVLMFDDSLTYICNRLEQIYNVQFEIDSTLTDNNFHIILRGENISEITHMIEICAPVRCEIRNAADSLQTRQRVYITPLADKRPS